MKEAPNLKSMSEKELLQMYATLIDEFRDRHIIRSSNNPVADYAEKVAEEYLGLRRVGKEEKGYDAVDNRGNRYQVKGRRITRYNKSRQLNVIRNLDERLFDFLIVVIFHEDFSVSEIWRIPHQFVKQEAKWSDHQNGYIFYAIPKVLAAGRGISRVY